MGVESPTHELYNLWAVGTSHIIEQSWKGWTLVVICLKKEKKMVIRYSKILLSRVNSPLIMASTICDATILRSPQDYFSKRFLTRQIMSRGPVGNRAGDGVVLSQEHGLTHGKRWNQKGLRRLEAIPRLFQEYQSDGDRKELFQNSVRSVDKKHSEVLD